MSKRRRLPRSLVSKVVSNPLIFDLLLAVLIVLTYALYQETQPGIWAAIRRILGRQ